MKTNFDTTLEIGNKVTGTYMDIPFNGTIAKYMFLGVGGPINYTIALDAPQMIYGIIRNEISMTAMKCGTIKNEIAKVDPTEKVASV